MFRAAVFDMDGLLIDSEPFWKLAERDVFGEVGIEISDEMAAVTAPMTTRKVAEHWFGVRPWREKSVEDMEAAVVARVADLIRGRRQAMPGVRRDSRIVRASSDGGWVWPRIRRPCCASWYWANSVLPRAFHAVVSADHVECGKPDPAIYLHAARLLGVPPQRMHRLRGLRHRSARGARRRYERGGGAFARASPSLKEPSRRTCACARCTNSRASTRMSSGPLAA